MFNADGSLGWSTYFGGSFSDESNGVAILPDGEIAIVGGTYSTNLPVTYDALRTSNSGDYDMFVAVFSGGGTRIWATYFGGWSMDYANAVASDGQGNLYVTGHTESTNFPVAGKTQQSAYAGGAFDAFVMKIGRGRQLDWATYYGGEQEDSGTRIGLDAQGHVIVAGYTASTDFPVPASAYRTRHGGILDAFVLSLENSGGLRWATYLGGKDIDRVGGLAVHPDGEILLTGFTGSKDFPVAGNPVRASKSAGYDVFISKFDAAGGYVFGSFYGGSDHDIGNAVAVDARGNVTIAGGSESPDLERFGTQVQPEIGGLTDAFLIRLVFDEPMADAGRDTVICRGGSAVIGGTVSGGQPPYLYFWRPSDQMSSDRVARPAVTPYETTSYIVTVTDTEGAKSSDTIVVSVSMPPTADAGTDVHVCPGDTHALEGKALGGQAPYTWSWSPGATLNDSTLSMPVASPRHSTAYTLTVTDANGCSSRDTVIVNHHAFLIADLGADRSSCAGESLQLSVSVTGGNQPYSYIWTSLGNAGNPGHRRSPSLPYRPPCM